MMKERRQKSKIHCLPDELLYEIGALLDDADLCKTELTSRRLHDVLSKPSATVPGKLIRSTCSSSVERLPDNSGRLLRLS